MNGLTVKNVEFNGATLRAAQDLDNVVWVGVRWVCQGIGMSDGKVKSERKKIQEDLVLKQGTRFLPLGTGNSDSEVLCLMLDFLPLWLAKISITPTMKRETPELVANLIEYQLKAKDVLSDAFLKKQSEIVPTQNTVTLKLPDFPSYTEQFEILLNRIDDLDKKSQVFFEGMSNMAKLLLEIKQKDDSGMTKAAQKITTVREVNSQEDIWKKNVYEKAGNIVCSSEFKKTSSVLKHIYDYMNRNYGICWEQESKDFKDKNHISYIPKTIELVYSNENLRSIFTSVLTDLEYKCRKKNEEMLWSDRKIKPLVDKYKDRSRGYMVTYRKVYTQMEEDYNIGWKNLTTRYINEFGGKPSKKDLVNTRKSLQIKFVKAIKKLEEQ